MNLKVVSVVNVATATYEKGYKDLRILSVTSEVKSIATGGLGGAVDDMSSAFQDLGADVRIAVPGYTKLLNSGNYQKVDSFRLNHYGQDVDVDVLFGNLPKTSNPAYVFRIPWFFERGGSIYHDEHGKDFLDNDDRFSVFSRAVWEHVIRTGEKDWCPNILHGHDWHVGPAFGLRALFAQGNPMVKSIGTMFTVHNVAYNGTYDMFALEKSGLQDLKHYGEFYGGYSFLRMGINTADAVTTVSPNHALELLSEKMSFGLYGDFKRLHSMGRFFGIMNGINQEEWNPETNKNLHRNYGKEGFREAREENKRYLIEDYCKMHYEPGLPVFSFIGRLTWQKGTDCLVDGVREFLSNNNAYFVALGSGDSAVEEQLRWLKNDFPDRINVDYGFKPDNRFPILAGSDVALMPSRFEPCGLFQLECMRLGTAVIGTPTGGIADSIINYSLNTRTGNGFFMFDGVNPHSIAHAMHRASYILKDEEHKQEIVKQAMRFDSRWQPNAVKYLDIALKIKNGELKGPVTQSFSK